MGKEYQRAKGNNEADLEANEAVSSMQPKIPEEVVKAGNYAVALAKAACKLIAGLLGKFDPEATTKRAPRLEVERRPPVMRRAGGHCWVPYRGVMKCACCRTLADTSTRKEARDRAECSGMAPAMRRLAANPKGHDLISLCFAGDGGAR